MPLERPYINFFQLGFLLLIVPAQYLLTIYFRSPSQSVFNFPKIGSLTNFVKDHLFFKSWHNSLLQLLSKFQEFYNSVMKFNIKYENLENYNYINEESIQNDEEEVSPALEVLTYRQDYNHFSGSKIPRQPRPSHVMYRVGQVIKHKVHGYRGVIIGWDEITTAPDVWIKQMYPLEHRHMVNKPSYSVLVDNRDRVQLQTTYVNEENIELIPNFQIIHEDIPKYFESFDGNKYILRPKLKEIYPED